MALERGLAALTSYIRRAFPRCQCGPSLSGKSSGQSSHRQEIVCRPPSVLRATKSKYPKRGIPPLQRRFIVASSFKFSSKFNRSARFFCRFPLRVTSKFSITIDWGIVFSVHFNVLTTNLVLSIVYRSIAATKLIPPFTLRYEIVW